MTPPQIPSGQRRLTGAQRPSKTATRVIPRLTPALIRCAYRGITDAPSAISSNPTGLINPAEQVSGTTPEAPPPCLWFAAIVSVSLESVGRVPKLELRQQTRIYSGKRTARIPAVGRSRLACCGCIDLVGGIVVLHGLLPDRRDDGVEVERNSVGTSG